MNRVLVGTVIAGALILLGVWGFQASSNRYACDVGGVIHYQHDPCPSAVVASDASAAPAATATTTLPGRSNWRPETRAQVAAWMQAHPAEVMKLRQTLAQQGVTGEEAETIVADLVLGKVLEETPEPAPTPLPEPEHPPTPAELAEAAALDNSFFVPGAEPPYHPAENEDLNSSTPASLYSRIQDACHAGSQAGVFANFTYSFRWAFSRLTAAQRQRSFGIYCKDIDQGLAELPHRRFFILKSQSIEKGVHKSELCGVPEGAPDSECHGGMDVAIEDGQLKIDEF